jgi:RNA polymerase sigma-70 factor (ECF subfamily)
MATFGRSPDPRGRVERAPGAASDALNRRARMQLAALFDRHESQILGFLLSRTGDRALAEDLTTETFLALARRAAHDPAAIDGVDASALVTISRRRLIDHWRSVAARRRRLEVVGREMATDPPADGPGADLDPTDDRVVAALASLSDRQRAALTLRHLDEMTVSEVAEVLDASYEATESILARARRAFRVAYERDGAE